MLDWIGIYTWDDFATLLGCMAQVAAVVLPTAIILYFISKKGLDVAYGCMVKLKHNNNKRKKGK
jgi:hypothetical protein